MKKKSIGILVLMALILPLNLYSQGLIMKATSNGSRWIGTDTEHNERKFRMQYGLEYGFALGEKLFLVPGANYSQRGMNYFDSESIDLVVPTTYKIQSLISLNYVDIQLPVRYYINETIFISAGVYQSFLVSETGQFTFAECIDSRCTGDSEEVSDIEGIEKTEIGYLLTIGCLIKDKWFLEAFSQRGLTSITEDDKIFNDSIGLSMGYKF